VRRYPAAYTDHAARFWLGPGKSPTRALALALKGARLRATRDAQGLVVAAALGAHRPGTACRAAQAALAMPPVPGALRVLAAQAFRACGEGRRADAELARATEPR
jgi:hypothetical protein